MSVEEGKIWLCAGVTYKYYIHMGSRYLFRKNKWNNKRDMTIEMNSATYLILSNTPFVGYGYWLKSLDMPFVTALQKVRERKREGTMGS